MMCEALLSNDLLNFLLYDSLSPSQFNSNPEFPEHKVLINNSGENISTSAILQEPPPPEESPLVELYPAAVEEGNELGVSIATAAGRGRKRRRRKVLMTRKTKEEVETQRMTHIALERNRRKQMNQHLAALRSLMPQSYAHKGDQASIVGGAIDYIKELEHHLQTLESQKLQQNLLPSTQKLTFSTLQEYSDNSPPPSLSQFFLHSYDDPFNSNHINPETKHTSRSSIRGPLEDVDVTLFETHANIRILSRRRCLQRQREKCAAPARLSKLVAALHSLSLSVLHLSVTTMNNSSALYSISTKTEGSCELSTGDDIAGAVHHVLSLIEDDDESPKCFISINTR